MIINLTDEQVQRYTEALERALDCPFIQADDELYDDLLMLQEKMMVVQLIGLIKQDKHMNTVIF